MSPQCEGYFLRMCVLRLGAAEIKFKEKIIIDIYEWSKNICFKSVKDRNTHVRRSEHSGLNQSKASIKARKPSKLITLTFGNDIVFKISKCLSNVRMYSALAEIAKSEYLLSSISSIIKFQ